MQVVRSHFVTALPHTGLLAAMFDRRLAAAIAVIHTRWDKPLTLLDLADAAGMSRSAFAYRWHQPLTAPAQSRSAIEVMRLGCAIKLFQASQQASTMAS